MTNRNFFWSAASAVFVLMLILSLILTDVQLVAFNRSYYVKQYEKYNIPESIGIEMPELMSATEKLLDYMDRKREDLDFKAQIRGQQQEFFSQRDKLHMIDVKNLFVQGKLIRNIAFGYCVLFVLMFFYKAKGRRRAFSRLMIYTFVAGIIPILLLAILMNVDFYKYFTIFHEIFFNNDLWLLDPAADRLINMYPQAFFSDTAFRIVYYYIGELLALLIFGILGLRYRRRNSI